MTGEDVDNYGLAEQAGVHDFKCDFLRSPYDNYRMRAFVLQ